MSPRGEGAQIARLHALFEAISLAIAIFDSEQRLVSANAKFRELTGHGRPAGARPVRSTTRFRTRSPISPTRSTRRCEGRPVVAYSRRRSSIAAARASSKRRSRRSSEPGASGARGIVFAGNDVTEREELRESLARSVSQLESIFDVIPDSVRVFDTDGRTVRSNTQAQQDHAPGQPSTLRELWQLDRPRTLDGTSLFMHEHPTARALRGERVRGETLAVRRGPENQVIIEVNSNPLYDEHGHIRGAVTVERDVTFKMQLAKTLEEEARRTAELYERVSTEAERLERMVQERTQELLALQEARSRERRLAAVGQLAAGVMHDVNNALNPIMAAAYLLEANAEKPDRGARLRRAHRQGGRDRRGDGGARRPLHSPGAAAGRSAKSWSTSRSICDEVVAMTRPLWAERARGGKIQLERRARGRRASCAASPASCARRCSTSCRTRSTRCRRRHARHAHDDRRRTRGAARGARHRHRHDGRGARARVRAVLHDEGQDGHRTRPRRGVRHREAASRRRRRSSRCRARARRFASVCPARVAAGRRAAVKERTRREVARRVLLVEDHTDSREFMQALLETRRPHGDAGCAA